MLQLLQRGDRSAQEPATRMGHIYSFMLVQRICLLAAVRDNTGCMVCFWHDVGTLNFLIVCAVRKADSDGRHFSLIFVRPTPSCFRQVVTHVQPQQKDEL